MVVKLTQEQVEFLGTFGNIEDEINKKRALYHIARFGYGYNLTDGDKCKSSAFEYSEQVKMIEAVINGYEVIVPKFKFYNFSDKTRFAPLYYAGEEELTSYKEFAKEVEENSEEYVALKLLGFIKEEV